MSADLTKSDFKAARECAAKLYYRKRRYPSLQDEDDFLQLLAEGGFIVGKMAQLLHPDGIEITAKDSDSAVAETLRLLERSQVTLFEPAIRWDNLLVRVDILVKRGNRIDLIEVKSKGIDPQDGKGATPFLTKNGAIQAEWVPYIEDVAYQAMVCRRAHPEWQVTPHLMLVDKTRQARVDGLAAGFEIIRETVPGRPRPRAEAHFQGDPNFIREHHVLRTFDVTTECTLVDAEVAEAADTLAPFLKGSLRKPPARIGTHCRDCEYRVDDDVEPNGFRECWGSLADPRPHLLELHQMGNARIGGVRIAQSLIEAGKTSLYDLPAEALEGKVAARQQRQIQQTRSGKPWIDPALPALLRDLEYPLHFVDFEATRAAVPPHQGMVPYDLIAFQWSCHTIEQPGGPLRHSEWINVDQRFPNFEFAAALRAALGDHGTLLTWSPYEKTSLREIVRQSDRIPGADPAVIDWVDRLVPEGVKDLPRMVDLCELARHHYYHPEMKGSYSIKAVLPAVWREGAALRQRPDFAPYVREENGVLLNPYDTLPSLEISGEAERVAEGTGAIRAYEEMIYGTLDPETRATWKRLLLDYCKLDTLAMVFVWRYWTLPKA